MASEYDFESSLKVYYQRLFPFKDIHKWISYGNDNYFQRREFSFTFKGDRYARFRSFNDFESLSKEVVNGNPVKIDIGAVYNVAPKDKANYGNTFTPVEKELVFDIDMSDYNPIRTCCTGTNVCDKCWPWMATAMKVIDFFLREDFGFQNLLWVFSGRRGVHCWVCDSRARKLSAEARSSIAQYMNIFAGGEGKSKAIDLGKRMHPTLKKLYERVLLPTFENHILEGQHLLDDPEQRSKLLALIPQHDARTKLEEFCASNKDDSAFKWATIVRTLKEKANDEKPIHDIVFTYTYPRLDINVSTGLNHLLKAPFCVHPSTGAVCIPINPEYAFDFSPSKVPHVDQLIKELDAARNLGDRQDYKKTQLAPHITYFLDMFLKPLLQVSRVEQDHTNVVDF